MIERLEKLYLYGDDDSSEVKGDVVNYALIFIVNNVSKLYVYTIEASKFEKSCTNKVWLKAMKEDMDSIEKNSTWELVYFPKHRKVVGYKWVYKIKKNSDRSIKRYKARLIVKGFTHKYGLDYEDTFALVARQEIVQMLLSLAVHK